MTFSPTTLEISLKNLTNNYNYLRSLLNPGTKFMAVIKAFGYGSDMIAIAQHLESLNTDFLAVAFTHEGVLLRKHGIRKPILIIHPQPETCHTMVEYQLEPSIYSKRIWEAFIRVCPKDRSFSVHVNINTGLNRLGLSIEDAVVICDAISQNTHLNLASTYSHLAASEDLSESDFTLSQIERFKTALNHIKGVYKKDFLTHIVNTSGILNYADVAQFDMVRSGIGLQGYADNPNHQKHLLPVATLKTGISQIHSLKKGDSLGYNRGLIARETMQTATLPIGYADGIGSVYGKGKGYVYINGKKALILGNVCMDMIMVDVTDIDCREGDEVVVFGGKYSAEDLAGSIGTISYEVITTIASRTKRVILD